MTYRADIEIAVRGAQQLRELQSQVKATSKLVDSFNSYLENIGSGGVVRSIDNLRSVVGQAAEAFNKAALGTNEALIAARQYASATQQLNQGLEERLLLLNQIAAAERASRRRVVPSDAGYGQQTPALPPGMVRAQEIQQNWAAFFRDANELGSDLRSTATARGINIRTNWISFFEDAAELGAEIKTTTAAKSLNLKNNWTTFFNEATEVANDIKTTTAAKSLNLKNNWTTFFNEATEVANDIKTTTAAKSLNLKNNWTTFFNEATELATDLITQTQQASAAIRSREGAASEAARQRLAAEASRRNRIRDAGFGMQGPAEPSRQTQQQIVRSENNQKRLNNLLTSAQIIEQKTVQLKSKGVNVSSQQATIQNVITSIQQSGTNVTKQYLAALDNVLNSLRNELKLQKEILVTQKQQNKETKAVTTSEKKQDGDLGGRLSSATIGGFFPLLFGQGPGAALGGAVGGFAGGGKFGFAGSLAGTFAGQATIDFAVNSAVRLGQALRSPTKNIDELTKFLGIAGTQLNTNIKILQALGLESVASAAALAQLEEVLGKEGYKNAEKLAKDLTEVENAFGRLQLAAANALSQPLGQFLDFLADVINQFNGIDIRQGGGRLGRLAQTAESNPPGTQRNTAQTTPPTAQAATEKAISDERARQIRLASEQKRLDQDRLGLTRIELAIRENDITLLQSANELERKRLILKNAQAARDKERVALVQMELDVLEQQREQQEAVKRNAVIEAERAVYRDNANLLNRQFETLVATRNLTADKVTLEKGELAGIIKRYDILEKEFNQRHSILKNQLRLETLGVNEQSIREEILTTYDLQFIQLKEEIDLRRETYKQQYAQYKLTELQTKQALQLQEVQTRAQAQLEIGRARSFSDPQGIGLFGEARRSRNVGIQEYAANVAGMQTQLAAGEEALMQATTDAVNPDTLIQMNNALNIQRQQLALYKELQPQVIQARYEQEKYNEILGYTTQVTNGLFDGLNNVVAGTTSVQEAFGNLLNSIADMLLDFAKQAIVQYIAIGIARTFAGVPPASATGSTNLSGGIFQGFANNGSGIPLAPSFGGFRANGGPVTGGSPYIVGERGPELFVPGRSGTIIPNDRMPTGGGVQVGTINITVENTGEQLSPQAQKQIAGQVRGIVLATLVDQQRGGGVLR